MSGGRPSASSSAAGGYDGGGPGGGPSGVNDKGGPDGAAAMVGAGYGERDT